MGVFKICAFYVLEGYLKADHTKCISPKCGRSFPLYLRNETHQDAF